MIFRRSLVGLIALVAITSARPAAQPQDELTISPYRLLHGGRGMIERAVIHERLADAAIAAGDPARAARHLAMSCYDRSELVLDVTLRAPACGRARELAKTHHVADVQASLLTTEGNLRAWSLDVTGAIATLQSSIATGAGIDLDSAEGVPINMAHFSLGAILIEAGQFDLARHELADAKRHCAASGSIVCAAFTDVWSCRLENLLGDLPAARAACDAAVPGSRADVFVDMNLGWIRADLEGALGHGEASLASLQSAWKAAQVRGGELLQPTLMHSIADAYVTLGRLDEAEGWQQQLERLMAAGVLPASYGPQTSFRRGQIAMARGQVDQAIAAFTIASESPMHEMAIEGDYQLSLARRRRGDLAGARQALERAITRVEGGRTSVGGAALRATYLSGHARAYGELIDVRYAAEGADAARPALDIAEASRARALLDQLSSAQVAGAAAPTLSSAAVQAALSADDVLIEYVSSDQRLLAITVTHDRVAITPLPRAGTASDLAKRVDFFSTLVQENDEAGIAPAARRLYADLLAPALEGVAASAHTLIIAADGPLHRLPFDALDAPTPVVDRWDVVTVPSASILARDAHQDRPSDTALIVSAPLTSASLAPLPAAPAEAAAIRRRMRGEVAELSGAAATKAALQADDLQRFAVLHFASHAVVDQERPLRSSLMLAVDSTGGDGRWTAEEIYRAKLRAGLVVLSACSTAAGATTAGEGVMSLSRAFLYAGAGATLATLWDVADAPGPAFADALYRELANGKALGAASAEARRALRRQGAPPRAWAAYAVTGNPAARIGISPRGTDRVATAGMAGLIALTFVIAALLWRGAARQAVRARA